MLKTPFDLWGKVKRSAVAAWNVVDDRTGLSQLVGPLASHLVPSDARWWYVFGSATLCAFMLQVVTGIALALVYIPSTSDAYGTLQYITTQAPLGRFLRGLHYYGASAMVLMVGIHMGQVYLFGSYKFPREMNWASGVLLLGCTLVMGFTGQLLRWDQNAVWSVVVASEQAGRLPGLGNWLAHFLMGGGTVGGSTLTRFFVVHVFVMPALIFAGVGLHLLLVMRHGISEPPRSGCPVDPRTYRKQYEELLARTGKPFWPDAIWRDAVASFILVVGICLFAAILGPPNLEKPPDPSVLEASLRPDWYFLWYFAVLALMPPWFENYFMVFGPMLVGLLLIIFPFVVNSGERSPRRRPLAVAIVIVVVMSIAVLTISGNEARWSPVFSPGTLSASTVGATQGPVYEGARLFETMSCLSCHQIGTMGGRRGPDLTYVGDKLTREQIILRIANGGQNMPAFASTLSTDQINTLATFLQSRRHSHP